MIINAVFMELLPDWGTSTIILKKAVNRRWTPPNAALVAIHDDKSKAW